MSKLDDLLNALHDDALTDAEAAELSQLINTDPDARRRYCQFAHLVSALRLNTAAPLSRELSEHPGAKPRIIPLHTTPLSPAPTLNRLRRSTWYPIAAALLLAAALTAVVMLRPGASKHPALRPADADAVLTDLSADARFTDAAGLALAPGAPLPTDELNLPAGRAQILFRSTAVVDLTGPCDFRMIDDNRGYLARGRLRAFVPAKAHGFSIQTPDGSRITDLGTEFTVILNPAKPGSTPSGNSGGGAGAGGGDLDLVVLAGRVALTPPIGAAVILTAGETRRVTDRHIIDPSALHPLAARLLYDRALARRDDLLVAYNFDSLNPADPAAAADRTIADLGPDDHVAHCINAAAAPGPILHTAAVALDGSPAGVLAHLPRARLAKSFTLLIDLRLDHLPAYIGSLMQTDGWADDSLHWNINRDGRVNVGLGKHGGNLMTDRPVFTANHLGRWTHLALVADADAHRISLYADGVEIMHRNGVTWQPRSVDRFTIGAWREMPDAPLSRTLNGAIDRFAIFTDALSPDQIRQWASPPAPPTPID